MLMLSTGIKTDRYTQRERGGAPPGCLVRDTAVAQEVRIFFPSFTNLLGFFNRKAGTICFIYMAYEKSSNYWSGFVKTPVRLTCLYSRYQILKFKKQEAFLCFIVVCEFSTLFL